MNICTTQTYTLWMNKKHFVCISPIHTHRETFIARFCFALIWFLYKCDICKRAFSTVSIFSLFTLHWNPYRVYSTTIDKSLLAKTIKMWRKKNKIQKGKNYFNVFKSIKCERVCECACMKTKAKTKEKQESTKIRWQMLLLLFFFRWYVCCLLTFIVLSPMSLLC